MKFAMKVPTEITSGKFRKKHISTFVTSVTISFGSTDDINSLMFMRELFSSLPGHIIVENLSLSKSKKYTEDDYVTISKKGGLSKIKSRIKFHWYSKKVASQETKKK